MNPEHPLQTILQACIDANENTHRSVALSAMHYQRAPAYHYDYRTIRLHIGHRSGKSVAIHSMATADDVILFASGVARDRWKQESKESKCAADLEVITYLPRMNVKPWRRIWIEDPSIVLKDTSPGWLYELLSIDYDQLFILLGN